MLISKMKIICCCVTSFLFRYAGVSCLIPIFGKFYADFGNKTYLLVLSADHYDIMNRLSE